VAYLGHADFLPRERDIEVDLAALVADAATGGGDGGPVVKRMVQFAEALVRNSLAFKFGLVGQCRRLPFQPCDEDIPPFLIHFRLHGASVK
jgi:hypothetical protein